ncbi:hypothetical protein HOP60_09320 [Halomonas daqingensis]|uniref:Uncharacterized protein n=1 Tax=Billgrantia desiderata TaxID=52021 RepID=A0ABS9B4V2_9GAMM|nr:hypothetical protein [Halomonas desiderata]MCE8042353.1 hypothetical protein [Halomonas desiderata]MCE8046928.1 hypothetical protein [Halomonas desiderata]
MDFFWWLPCDAGGFIFEEKSRKARRDPRRIVLCEGADERVLGQLVCNRRALQAIAAVSAIDLVGMELIDTQEDVELVDP